MIQSYSLHKIQILVRVLIQINVKEQRTKDLELVQCPIINSHFSCSLSRSSARCVLHWRLIIHALLPHDQPLMSYEPLHKQFRNFDGPHTSSFCYHPLIINTSEAPQESRDEPLSEPRSLAPRDQTSLRWNDNAVSSAAAQLIITRKNSNLLLHYPKCLSL